MAKKWLRNGAPHGRRDRFDQCPVKKAAELGVHAGWGAVKSETPFKPPSGPLQATSGSANLRAGMLRRMRRWLITLLLVLLPFQFSWAAVVSYCDHESGAPAQHVGHHDHEHVGNAADATSQADVPDLDDASGQHPDCGRCNASYTGLPMLMDACAPLGEASRPTATLTAATRTRAQAPPDRPQWLPLA